MRVLIINWRDPRNPQAGGAEVVTREHARRWIKAGHNVTWFSTRYTHSSPEEVVDGITIIRKGGILSFFFFVPWYILKNRHTIDLLFEEIHGFPFLTPLYFRGRKIVFIHEVAGEIWNKMFPFPINYIGRFLEKLSFLFYKKIPFITVSESTKADLRQLGIKQVTVITNGFHQVPIQPFIKETQPTLIFISRLVRMKGIEEVLRAFSLIHNSLPDAKLWIVGTGKKEYINSLRKLVKDLRIEKPVIFYGKVNEEEKFSLLRKAHLILHASVKEGWGLVIIEAASQETPAVVYNVGGLRDSVLHNKTGIVLSKNTSEEMAREVLALLTNKDKLKAFQKEGKKIAESLSWTEATTQSLRIIENP